MTTEIAIVEQVQQYPCIYDYNVPDYNRPDITNEAWNNVAQSLQLPVHECKEKWRNIRSSYVRSLKKSKRSYYLAPYMKFIIPFLKKSNRGVIEEINFNDDAEQHNDSANDSDKSDSRQEICVKLEAIDPIVFDAEMYNDPVDDDDDNINEEGYITFNKKKKPKPESQLRKALKRKMNLKRKIHITPQASVKQKCDVQNVSDLNPMRFFLLSLLPEFKTMDEEQMRLFKIKVMVLIDEIKGKPTAVRESLTSTTENERLQKRLINLLVKNLDKKADTEEDSE